jgi:hypothetical protein
MMGERPINFRIAALPNMRNTAMVVFVFGYLWERKAGGISQYSAG